MEFSEPTLAIDRQRYREAAVKMVVDFAPTHFVTFAFNNSVTAEEAEADLAKFKQWLCRAISGKRNRDVERLPHIAMIEHEASNLHVHAAFRVSKRWRKRFERHAPRLWQKLREAGSLNIQSVYDVENLAGYITKEMRPHESHRLLV